MTNKSIIAVIAGAALIPSTVLAECNDDMVDPPTIAVLAPITEEEQAVLALLEAIESNPEIVRQADEQAKVPLEAFGGPCNDQERHDDG